MYNTCQHKYQPDFDEMRGGLGNAIASLCVCLCALNDGTLHFM